MGDNYVDFTLGDDANAGTIAAPWKTLDKVSEYTGWAGLSPGESFLLKRGETWFVDGTVSEAVPYGASGLSCGLINGTSAAPIRIGAYGSGPKPIIESYLPIVGATVSGNWTDYGTTVANTWWIDGANRAGGNLFINDVKKYPAYTAGEVSSTKPWFVGDIGGTVRLLVFSEANPSTLDLKSSWAQSPLRIQSCTYVAVSDLDLRGGDTAVDIGSKSGGVASRYIVIEDCDIGRNSNAGMYLHLGAGIQSNENVTISGCTIDNGGPPMPPLSGEAGPPVLTDGILLYSGENTVIRDCLFGQWSHSSIYMYDDLVEGQFIRYSDIYNNTFEGDGQTYNRALGMDGSADGLCSYNLFHDNIIERGLTVRSQLNGNHNRFYNNTVNGPVNLPTGRVLTWPDAEGIQLQGYAGPCHHNEVTGNTFTGLAGVGVKLLSDVSGGAIHHNVISGNHFVDCGNGSDADPLYVNVGIWVDPGTDVYSNTITDNSIVSPATKCVSYHGTLMTVAEFNAAAELGDIASGNYQWGNPALSSMADLIQLVNSELENHTSFGSWRAVGDGTTTSFTVAPLARYIVDDSTWAVRVSGVATTAFTMNFDSGVITFRSAPALSAPLTAKFNHAYWTEEIVTQAVNAGINNLFPAFYVPKADTSISLVADTYEYTLPAKTQFITAVETRADATGAYTKMARSKYEWLSDGDHLNLRFFSAPTGFMRVRCINRPSPLVDLADTLEATAGLPSRAKDPIISYACWYLLTQKIAPRVRSDIAVNTQGVGTLSPRQIADGTQAWMMRYQLQVAANRMPPWMAR